MLLWEIKHDMLSEEIEAVKVSGTWVWSTQKSHLPARGWKNWTKAYFRKETTVWGSGQSNQRDDDEQQKQMENNPTEAGWQRGRIILWSGNTGYVRHGLIGHQVSSDLKLVCFELAPAGTHRSTLPSMHWFYNTQFFILCPCSIFSKDIFWRMEEHLHK